MHTSFKSSIVAAVTVLAASGAFAQKAGDDIVSVGLASVNPSASLGKLTSTSSTDNNATGTYFTGALNNATAHVGNATTMSLGWLHMYSDNLGAEATIGLPPEVTQDLTTTTAPHPGAAKIKIWSPTLVAKYFFGTAQDKWRPYVGLGASYVSFHNIAINSNDSTVRYLASTSASFSSAWTPVYNAGMIYNIDDKWSINGSVSYLPVKTTATFVGPGAPVGYTAAVTTTGDVKLNTTDYVIRVGYRF
jgi:outer membrane protein